MAIRPADQVRSMFTAISPRYDFLNHLLSLGLDRSWREVLSERVAAHLNERTRLFLEGKPIVGGASGPDTGCQNSPSEKTRSRPEAAPTSIRLIDVCCGTGDQSFSLATAVRPQVLAGVDFSGAMVALAVEKARRRGLNGTPSFFTGDALRLPFRDGSFDAATVAFGLRNVADYDAGLREMARVVRPGGRVYVIEFTMPRTPVVRDAYGFYFRRVLPAVGAFISRSPDKAYSYLPDSVMKFPSPDLLAKQMEDAGLKDVTYELLTFGTVSLHVGKKATH